MFILKSSLSIAPQHLSRESANGELSVLQDSASIIWSIFEDPMPLQDAIESSAKCMNTPIETMGPQIEGFHS